MEFNSTFTDPTRRVIYPSTWGGKTATERFEDMKKEFWYRAMMFLMSFAFGTIWWFIVYTYSVFVRVLYRASKYDEDHPERVPYEDYLQWNYLIRWGILGTVVYGSTIFMLLVHITRPALLYGLAFWGVVFIFKSQSLQALEWIKKRVLKDEFIRLNEQ